MYARLFRTTVASIAMAFCFTGNAAELVIGQVAPLTPNDSPGNLMRMGAQVYFDAINARGGVRGATLKFIAKDRGLKSEDAVTKTRELLAESQPIALTGLSGTGPMEALVKSKILEEAGLPVVGIRTGATSLHDPVNPLLFHTRANYAAEVDAIMAQLATVKLDRIGVFYEKTAFGKEGLSLIEQAAKRKNARIVATATYEFNSTEADKFIKALSDAKPSAVILVANSDAAAQFYKSWRASGNATRVVALSVTDAAEVVKKIGADSARGLIVTQVVPDFTNKTIPLVREFHENIKKYPQPGMVVNQTALDGYLSAKVLVEAIKRSGQKPTREKIRATLESMNHYDAGGVVISFSPTNHTGSKFVESALILAGGKLMR